MSQYWLNWVTDIVLVLTIAVVICGGSWVVYKFVRAVMKAWDEDTGTDGGDE